MDTRKKVFVGRIFKMWKHKEKVSFTFFLGYFKAGKARTNWSLINK
jgi:hypothetical protein